MNKEMVRLVFYRFAPARMESWSCRIAGLIGLSDHLENPHDKNLIDEWTEVRLRKRRETM